MARCPCQIDESSRFYIPADGAFYSIDGGALGDGVMYALHWDQQSLHSWVVPGFAGPTLVYTADPDHFIYETVVAPDGAVYIIEEDTAPNPDVWSIRRVAPTVATIHTFAPDVSPASLGWTPAGQLVMLTGTPGSPVVEDIITMDPTTGTPTTLASSVPDLDEIVPTLDGGLWCANADGTLQRRNAAGTVTMTLAGKTLTYKRMIPAPGDTDSVVATLSGETEVQIIHPDGTYGPYGCAAAIPPGNGHPLPDVGRLWNPDQTLIWQFLRTSSEVLRIDDWTNPCDRRWWVGTTGFSA